MCPRHEREHNRKRNEERRKTKARVAARERDRAARAMQDRAEPVEVAMSEPVLTEPDVVVEPVKSGRGGRHPRVELSPEQEVEILDAYTTTAEPVGQITARYGIRDTYIYNVLDRAAVSWRRNDPISFTTWQAQQARPAEPEPDVPAPVVQALENMLKLPAKPEPVAAPARTRQPAPLIHFEVTVFGSFGVDAPDILSAMHDLIGRYPDLRITAIRESAG